MRNLDDAKLYSFLKYVFTFEGITVARNRGSLYMVKTGLITNVIYTPACLIFMLICWPFVHARRWVRLVWEMYRSLSSSIITPTLRSARVADTVPINVKRCSRFCFRVCFRNNANVDVLPVVVPAQRKEPHENIARIAKRYFDDNMQQAWINPRLLSMVSEYKRLRWYRYLCMYVHSHVPVLANPLFHVPRSAVISNGQQINSATGNVPQTSVCDNFPLAETIEQV